MFGSRLWQALVSGVFVTAALAIAPTLAHGHELGKGHVVAMVQPGRAYEVTVVVDPDALLTRLQVAEGQVPVAATSVTAQAQRIRALLPSYLRHTTLALDEEPQSPAIEYISPHEQPGGHASTADSGPAGLIRLTGVAKDSVSTIRFGTSMIMGAFALTLKSHANAPGVVHWLTGGTTSESFVLQPSEPVSTMSAAVEYVQLGFTHILPKGLDHILFVVGLFLLSATWRALLWQVSAFTVAHSLTLALAMTGVVRVSPSIVEPLIALSIAYIAVENLVAKGVSPWRVAVVFLFGLLHGLGFAGVLSELGLPDGQLLTALLSFNVGVEAGQVTVVALAWLAVGYWKREASGYRRFVVAPASITIAITGLYWTLERLAGV